jgi:uncharacterized lipoprotein YddW (UPF0748 family)
MKKILIYQILSLISFGTVALSAQTNNEEFRSTWVITWEYISSGSSVEQNKTRIREIMDNHVEANMTSVLFQIRQGGTAYYNSSYEPWGSYAGSSYPGFDPLEYAVEEAHKRGLELHAWFNTFSVSSTAPGTIADKHPDWICRDRNGNPMTSYRAASPGLKAVRDYTVDVAMEIVRNYDVDGLHLDYVRWNEYDMGDMDNPLSMQEQVDILDGFFSKERMERLGKTLSTDRFLYDIEHPYSAGVPSGHDSWEDFWRWSVTEFVRTLHDSIQAVKPWVRLTPAALGKYRLGGEYGWNGYYVVFQDAALWFNEGYVDQLTPMHYHWLTGNEMYNHISSDWEPYIQQGINEGRLYSCGPPSYRLSDNNVWNNHQGIVERLRDKEWVDGFQFFSYGSWKGADYFEEAGSTFFSGKAKVRYAYDVDNPAAPAVELNKIDSITYELTVTPDLSETENQWYAVYRSEDEVQDVSADEILSIHFGNSSYTFTDKISGLQNFDSTYMYYATSLNRYWNESEPSNSVYSDDIPSFAPVVVSSSPVNDEVFKFSDNIQVQFSKSMNTASVENALSITPEIQINSYSWSDNDRFLKILSENFQFDTEYIVKIDSTAADVNGTPLDGNGDGIPGDSFIITFSTEGEDIYAPEIEYSYPGFNDANVDVASIITIVFDEKIDNSSLSGGIELRDEQNTIGYKALITYSQDGKSILAVQPDEMFSTNTEYSLILTGDLADTLGNAVGSEITLSFRTSAYMYSEILMIDNFTSPGDWQQPSYSGSTIGILESETHFDFTSSVAIPVPTTRKSARLRYQWLDESDTYRIREYLSGGAPRSVYFDTSYVLQTYVHGDGSNNQFRFCIDELPGTAAEDHEVSQWITIDWNGWKLVEWQLEDPGSVGSWIGNEILDGEYYRIDSYQLTKPEYGLYSGVVYFDDLRAVKKVIDVTAVETDISEQPDNFELAQNYPNPFSAGGGSAYGGNPHTTIEYKIPSIKQSALTQVQSVNNQNTAPVTLKIYDILGREVAVLVNEEQSPGNYRVTWNASGFASGVYFYRLTSGSYSQIRKMMLTK